MINRLLDDLIRWLSAIGTVFCSYKALVAIDVVQNKSTWYSSPFTLEGALVLYLIGVAFCLGIGLWWEISLVRRDRKAAKKS